MVASDSTPVQDSLFVGPFNRLAVGRLTRLDQLRFVELRPLAEGFQLPAGQPLPGWGRGTKVFKNKNAPNGVRQLKE